MDNDDDGDGDVKVLSAHTVPLKEKKLSVGSYIRKKGALAPPGPAHHPELPPSARPDDAPHSAGGRQEPSSEPGSKPESFPETLKRKGSLLVSALSRGLSFEKGDPSDRSESPTQGSGTEKPQDAPIKEATPPHAPVKTAKGGDEKTTSVPDGGSPPLPPAPVDMEPMPPPGSVTKAPERDMDETATSAPGVKQKKDVSSYLKHKSEAAMKARSPLAVAVPPATKVLDGGNEMATDVPEKPSKAGSPPPPPAPVDKGLMPPAPRAVEGEAPRSSGETRVLDDTKSSVRAR
jgi:hypothetical protein